MMTTTIEQVEEQQKKLNQMIADLKASIPGTYGIPEALIELKSGEHYAGIALGAEGEPSHHLILLPNEAEDATFNEAVDWAKEQGGELPSREEQALLFANLKKYSQQGYHWSGIEHPSNKGYAFVQCFASGGQDYYYKGNKFRARAVRRLPIQRNAA